MLWLLGLFLASETWPTGFGLRVYCLGQVWACSGRILLTVLELKGSLVLFSC